MSQQFLFDVGPQRVNQYDVPIEVPVESLTKELVGHYRKLFLESLQASSRPLTANEVAFEHTGGDVVRESIRKRAKELVDLGLVVVCEKRQCLVTGKTVTTYAMG